jgi:2-methylcitrate dehydratase PrpD
MSVIEEVAGYLARAGATELPGEVRERAALHLLDTVAAMVSGSRLPAARVARAWAHSQGRFSGGEAATIVGMGERTSPVVAALCNGMAAHADETDDSHPDSLSHPGCAVVPAALAGVEAVGGSGSLLLRSVAAGYDIGGRVGRAAPLKERDVSRGGPSSHAMVGAFGATAAAAVALGLDATQVRHSLSYATQLCSGTLTWMRDPHHVEKAFVFGGMPASQGLLATTLVRAGGGGVEDAFSGRPNWLDGLPVTPDREALVAELGSRYEVMRTTLKKYSVGSPAQAAVEAMVELVRDHSLQASEVEGIEISLPSDSYFIVDGRDMPSINCQYLVVGTLQDGRFSFEMAHDTQRMRRDDVVSLLSRTVLAPDETIRGTRAARLRVTRRVAGRVEVLEHEVTHVRGTAAIPMSVAEVREKSLDLMGPVLGAGPAAVLCDRLLALDGVPRVGELTPLMAGASQ